VKCENTQDGDKVAIVGGCPELGDWKTQNDSSTKFL